MYVGVDVTRKFFQNFELDIPTIVLKIDMIPFHKLLFHFVHSCILQRFEMRHEDTLLDMTVMKLLDTGRPINLSGSMIKYMEIADTTKTSHAIPYGFLLTGSSRA